MQRTDMIALAIGGLVVAGVIAVAAAAHASAPDAPTDIRRALATPVAIPEGMVWVTVDIGAALERSEVDWDEGFALDLREEDIVGRADLAPVQEPEGPRIFGAEGRRWNDRGAIVHLVSVRFSGTWMSSGEEAVRYPFVLDEEGYPLRLWSGGAGCGLNSAGDWEGESSVEAVVDPDEVGVLTYVLGPADFEPRC